MREIIFRGKPERKAKWLYGAFLWVDGKPAIYEGTMRWEDCAEMSGLNDWDYISKDSLGQYTGLKTKDGKEIWEGDIVKTPLLDPIFGDIISDDFCNAEIRFQNGSFVVSYYKRGHNIYLQDLYDKIEVVGNVFDNKDLLED